MQDKNKQLFWLTAANRVIKGVGSSQNNLVQPNAAPLALPMTVPDPKSDINLTNVQTINVVKNFNWTNTDIHSRELLLEDWGNMVQHDAMRGTLGMLTAGVPTIILNEYRVTFSSALANLRYQIGSLSNYGDIMKQGIGMAGSMAVGTAEGLATAGAKVVQAGTNKIPIVGGVISKGTDAAASVVGKSVKMLAGGGEAMANSLISLQQGVATSVSSGLNQVTGGAMGWDQGSMKDHPHLSPYSGLYLGAPSGFRYVFPYLTSQQYRQATSAWADQGHSALQNFVGTLAGGLQFIGGSIAGAANAIGQFDPTGLAEKAGSIASFAGEGSAKALTAPLDLLGAGVDLGINATQALTPGHSLEQTKTYAGYGATQPINVTFYLSNTKSFEEVVSNWHLMFLLQYQNLPNKNNKVSLEPPVMYEVSIPGHYYAPFSFINQLSIEGLGNTRTMEIPVKMLQQVAADIKASDPETVAALAEKASQALKNNVAAGNNVIGFSKKRNAGSHSMGVVDTIIKGFRALAYGKESDVKLPSHIAVPIPEAYRITIGIQSLVPDAKNFTYHALTNSSTLYTASLARHMDNAALKAKAGYSANLVGGAMDPKSK